MFSVKQYIITKVMDQSSHSSLPSLPSIQNQPKIPRLLVGEFSVAQSHKECRICLQTQQQSFPRPLLTPCKCTGTISHVHENCLQQWIQRTAANNKSLLKQKAIECQLCKYKIKFQVAQKRSCNGCREIGENIRGKVVLFCLVLVLFVLSTVGCVFSLYILWQQSKLLENPSGLYFVVILSICGALFALLFLAVALYLFIAQFLLYRAFVIGKIKEPNGSRIRNRKNQIIPINNAEPNEHQSISYLNYTE